VVAALKALGADSKIFCKIANDEPPIELDRSIRVGVPPTHRHSGNLIAVAGIVDQHDLVDGRRRVTRPNLPGIDGVVAEVIVIDGALAQTK
jgi:hypothetical protein